MAAALTTSDYKQLTTTISGNVRKLKEGVPDVIAGFNAMGKAALAPGVIDAKTKELIALAIGVAARCDGCLGFHTQALVRLGATREEVNEMLGVAVYMGGGPSLMYAASTVAAFDEALAAAAAK